MPHWERPQRCPGNGDPVLVWIPYVTDLEDRDYSDFIAVGSLRPRSRIRTTVLEALAVEHGTGVSELVDIGVLLVLHITSSSICVTNSILFLECSPEIGHS